MRVAVWHNLPSGGGKRALYEHVRGLVARGHTVEVWSPPSADQTYLPLTEFSREHVVPLRRVPTYYPTLPPAKVARLIWGMSRDIAAMDEHCRQCADEINSGGFDVLFANACTFYRTTAIGRFTRIPSAIYLGEPYRWLYEALPRLPWLALPSAGWRWWTPGHLARATRDHLKVRSYRIQAREELRNAEGFDTILVNSLFSRESVLRTYGLDSKVCYLGVDTDKFTDLGYDREPVVVGIGAFVPEKNIDFVIESLAKVAPPRPQLVWIGNVAKPEYLQQLQLLAQEHDVPFVPLVRISDAQLIEVLNRAMLMVYAPRLEPFGLAPLEANACGLPVVAVGEGGVRESITHAANGLLVEHDPAAMGAAIEHLIRNPAYAREMGKKARTQVLTHWTLDQATDRLEQHLVEVMRKRSSRSARSTEPSPASMTSGHPEGSPAGVWPTHTNRG